MDRRAAAGGAVDAGARDAGAFIAGFAGDDRYIVDYLVEEVLVRQPDDVRGFLIRDLDPRPVDRPAVRRRHRAAAAAGTLEALERANLFVVPLDDSRRWYRYHHLFADVLRTHLPDEQPDRVADLHRRASQWYDRAR